MENADRLRCQLIKLGTVCESLQLELENENNIKKNKLERLEEDMTRNLQNLMFFFEQNMQIDSDASKGADSNQSLKKPSKKS